jgi:hypothetical protein
MISLAIHNNNSYLSSGNLARHEQDLTKGFWCHVPLSYQCHTSDIPGDVVDHFEKMVKVRGVVGILVAGGMVFVGVPGSRFLMPKSSSHKHTITLNIS